MLAKMTFHYALQIQMQMETDCLFPTDLKDPELIAKKIESQRFYASIETLNLNFNKHEKALTNILQQLENLHAIIKKLSYDHKMETNPICAQVNNVTSTISKSSPNQKPINKLLNLELPIFAIKISNVAEFNHNYYNNKKRALVKAELILIMKKSLKF